MSQNDTEALRRALDERGRELDELRRDLHRNIQRLERLIEITRLLNSTLDVDSLLATVIDAASELVDAETGSLLLRDEQTGDLVLEVATGEPGARVVELRVPPGQGVAGWVVANSTPVVVNDARADPRFYAEVDEVSGYRTATLLAVPVRTADETIGALEVINKRGAGQFEDEDVQLSTALADNAGIAIQNARLHARLADAVVASRMSYRF
jgi:GAF domain-containing protein